MRDFHFVLIGTVKGESKEAGAGNYQDNYE
jgi:hypothetical protein